MKFKNLLLALGCFLLSTVQSSAAINREDIWIRDPFVVADDSTGTYTMYGTDILSGYQSYSTTDPTFRVWDDPVTAFTRPPGFWGGYDFWGGDVHEYNNEYYYLGSAASVPGGWHSMFVLKSSSPAGPFSLHSDLHSPITDTANSVSDGTLHFDDSGVPWLVYSQSRQVNPTTVIQDMRAVEMLSDLSNTIPATDYKLFDGSDFPHVTNFGSPPAGNTVWIAEGAELYRSNTGELLMAWSSYTDINGAGRSDYAVSIARSSNGQLDGTWIQESEPLFSGDGAHGQIFEDLTGQLRLSLHTPNSFGIVPNHATFIPIYDTGNSVTFAEPNQPSSTVAYFRFEEGVPLRSVVDGVDVLDVSGQGNHLRAFAADTAGGFSPEIPQPTISKTGRPNLLSYDNSQAPGGAFATRDLFVQSGPLDSADYDQWTIEASINLSQHINGHHHTFLGRDGNGYNVDGKLAAFYFQVEPDDTLSLTFVDQELDVNLLASNFVIGTDQWYNLSAVSDGNTLSLYVDSNDGSGYQLIDQILMTGSNNALVDNNLAWSIGRGMYDGAVVDQFFGLIDEVRISNVALDPSDFLFATTPIVAGDFNADGYVDSTDLLLWQANFGPNGTADADDDNDSDGADFLIWQQNFNPAAAPLQSLPEPSTGLLLLAGVALLGVSPYRRERAFPHSKALPPLSIDLIPTALVRNSH